MTSTIAFFRSDVEEEEEEREKESLDWSNRRSGSSTRASPHPRFSWKSHFSYVNITRRSWFAAFFKDIQGLQSVRGERG